MKKDPNLTFIFNSFVNPGTQNPGINFVINIFVCHFQNPFYYQINIHLEFYN